jgi:hypothetical protein
LSGPTTMLASLIPPTRQTIGVLISSLFATSILLRYPMRNRELQSGNDNTVPVFVETHMHSNVEKNLKKVLTSGCRCVEIEVSRT